MQKFTFYDNGLGFPLDVEIYSDVQIMKIIEMITLGNIKEIKINQSYGRFYITEISRNGVNVFLELSKFTDATKPNTVGSVYRQRVSFCPTYLVGKIMQDIDLSDGDLYDNDLGEMNWVDKFGLNMMVNDGTVISVSKTGEISYDTYIYSHSRVGNERVGYYNTIATPRYYDRQLDYLIDYDEEDPIDSSAVNVPEVCEHVRTDLDTELRYLINDEGKLIVAYEIDGRHITNVINDSYIVKDNMPDKGALYKVGDEDTLNGFVILLHHVPDGESYAYYMLAEDFYREYLKKN